MSKKKNTLKDLDEFLKQQAATLVQPVSLGEQIVSEEPEKPKAKEQVIKPEDTKASEPELTKEKIGSETLLRDLKAFGLQEGPAFREKLCDLIIQSLEAQSQSLPEDKMLINTALYLKSGDAWKEAVRNYWKNK